MSASALVFYREPGNDTDRWLPGDRYPRRIVRRIVRGKRMTGHRRILDSLTYAFRKLGTNFRVNAFGALSTNERAADSESNTIGLLGKLSLLDDWRWTNPMVCGPAMLDHPCDRPDLFDRFNAKLYLVPGPWMHRMFEPYFGERVKTWPLGIDLDRWPDFSQEPKTVDVLVYVKFLWDAESNRRWVLEPIVDELRRRGQSWETIVAGRYTEAEYLAKLRRARRMIFLCEHETQGLAYQEALACNVPVLAWDQGVWLDPKARRYERDSVPVSSVPYFSADCGMTFRTVADFSRALDEFLSRDFQPRPFVAEHLDLADSARAYLEFLR